MFDQALTIVNADFEMADIKEGELSISALWFDLYSKIIMKKEGLTKEQALEQVKSRYPLPYSLDFRMHE